ncbi:hypothetical protein [Microbispora sp. NPDC049633]|uniref:hypothetical protein n=1 Tax=Microbispora sp. NPDC049633 TaxID=3154355 RepID=UPI003423019F
MMLIAALTNFDHLINLGRAIGMGGLAWSLPVAVITYEVISTAVFFTTPRQHAGLRKSAAIGAVLGLSMTMGLSALWQSIADGAVEVNLLWKLVLVPVPSLVGAAFLHQLVLAISGGHGEAEAEAEAEADAEADAVIAALRRPEAEATETATETAAPEAVVSVEAEAPPAPEAPEAPPAEAPAADSGSAPEAPQPEAPVLPVVPVAAASAPPRRPRVTAVLPPRPEAPEAVKLPRVAPEHVDRALVVLRRAVEAGLRPEDVKSGKVLKDFPAGVGDRTVRNALRVARFQLEMEARKQNRQQELLPV